MQKEWLELRQEKWLIGSMILMPILLTGLPFGILSNATADTTNLGAILELDIYANFSTEEIIQIVLLRQFLVLFLLMPMYLPSSIAAHSIVSEKLNHTLEPLLVGPIRTSHILIGKSIIAALPSVLITWLCYGIYALGTSYIVINDHVFIEVFTRAWLLAVLLWVPILSMLSVILGVMISSRTSDPRTAQQLTRFVVVPLLILFFAQLAGLLIIDTKVVIAIVLPLILVTVITLFAAVRLFDRENILINWTK